MAKQSKNNGTHVHMIQGSEGPKHDPYGFSEIWVERNGRRVKLHQGLCTWLEVPGKGRRHYKDDEMTDMVHDFKEATGMSPTNAERYWQRLRSQCKRCGCRETYSINGYPGETLHMCVRCEEIVYADFDRSAIE